MALAAAGDAEAGRLRRCHGSNENTQGFVISVLSNLVFRHIGFRRVVNLRTMNSSSETSAAEKFSFEKARPRGALKSFMALHGVMHGVSYSMSKKCLCLSKTPKFLRAL